MQAAERARGRGKSAAGEPPPQGGVPPELRAAIPRECSRRSASAISTPCRSPPRSSPSPTTSRSSNAPTTSSASSPNGTSGWASAASPRCRCSAAGPIGTRLAAFLEGDEPAVQFDTHRRPQRRRPPFHRPLRPAQPCCPASPARCLVSLIDKTAQVETEQSLRAEMLRDSLTGLPNRFAFNEQVEAVLEDPGFQPGSHAVLVVDMTRFSRVNECVGSLAGDELLITFARRLCLRASRRRPARPHRRRRVRHPDAARPRPRATRSRRRRADQGGAGRAVPPLRARDQGRLRDRLRAAERQRGAGRGGASQRPVRAQALQGERRRSRSTSRTRRGRRGAGSASRPSCGARSRRASLTLAYQPLIDLAHRRGRRLRGAGALGPSDGAARSRRPSSSRSPRNRG